METVYGSQGKDSDLRTEKEGLHTHDDSGGSQFTRCESESLGLESQRVSRENGAGYERGRIKSTVGGVLRATIDRYLSQLELKGKEVARLLEEQRQIETEISHLKELLSVLESV